MAGVQVHSVFTDFYTFANRWHHTLIGYKTVVLPRCVWVLIFSQMAFNPFISPIKQDITVLEETFKLTLIADCVKSKTVLV